MDLKEIKGRRRTGNKRDGWLIKDADYQWLIAKVEELELAASHTACPECREITQSSLTLSREEGRREGMERAAEIAETRMVGKGRGGEFYAHGVGVGECIAAAIRSEAKGEREKD